MRDSGEFGEIAVRETVKWVEPDESGDTVKAANLADLQSQSV